MITTSTSVLLLSWPSYLFHVSSPQITISSSVILCARACLPYWIYLLFLIHSNSRADHIGLDNGIEICPRINNLPPAVIDYLYLFIEFGPFDTCTVFSGMSIGASNNACLAQATILLRDHRCIGSVMCRLPQLSTVMKTELGSCESNSSEWQIIYQGSEGKIKTICKQMET